MQEAPKRELTAEGVRAAGITKARLEEMLARLHESHRWEAGETPEERRIIVAYWNTRPGYYSFYDCINQLVKDFTNGVLDNGAS